MPQLIPLHPVTEQTGPDGFPTLLSPIDIGDVRVRNRSVLTAATTNLGSSERRPTARHEAYYRDRARGGVGLVISEGLAVHPSAGATRLTIGAWDDGVIEPLARIREGVEAEGATFFVQLNHGGREHDPVVSRMPLLAPSPIASPLKGEVPHQMSHRDIAEIVSAFGDAARRVSEAGVAGIELHGAHGYLLQQFLSPLTNARSDEYGGSLTNRMRFVIEVLESVRANSDGAVGIRLSVDELVPGGLVLEDTQRIVEVLLDAGLLDFISASQTNYLTMDRMVPDMSYPEAPFEHLGAGVREVARGIPVIHTGRIYTPGKAEELLAAGHADMIGMTRAHIADPFIIAKASAGRTADICHCIGCNQGCVGRMFRGVEIGCVQNPRVGEEAEYGGELPLPVEVPRSVVVVGAGPAGMEAAWVSAARGHQVVLLEAASELGGQLCLYSDVPSRSSWTEVVRYRSRMIDAMGVDVRLGVTATVDDIVSLRPDAVILATGCEAAPTPERLLGGGGPVLSPWEVAATDVSGRRVLIYDTEQNFQAMTVAEQVAARGATVVIATPAAVVGGQANAFSRTPMDRRLAAAGVDYVVGAQLTGRTEGHVELTDSRTGTASTYDADLLILTGHRRARDSMLEQLENVVPWIRAVGDAAAPRQALEAIREGHQAAYAVP